jgi:hypothetical protein
MLRGMLHCGKNRAQAAGEAPNATGRRSYDRFAAEMLASWILLRFNPNKLR